MINAVIERWLLSGAEVSRSVEVFKVQDSISSDSISRSAEVVPPSSTSSTGGENPPLEGELEGAVTISIADTGIGMTPAQIAALFRLDAAQLRLGTAGEQGSGLGLIVCRELLEKHGATLHIESEPDRGSRFWFEL